MIEIFVCFVIYLITKMLEWTWMAIRFSIRFMFVIVKFFITLPFELLKSGLKGKTSKPLTKAQAPKRSYRDPIEKMEDHWDNHPEDLDLEDIFWLDELAGDD